MPYYKSKPNGEPMSYSTIIQNIARCNHLLRSNPKAEQRKQLILEREQLHMMLR